jgi:NAD(P)-dependent dehydrogenase (short-subunit alcohol dehydrogenase family)
MGELDGRIAVVTGASSGIGAVAAQRLASEGAVVICGARRVGNEAAPEPETLAHTVAQIRGRGGQAQAVALDVAKAESRAEFMDAVLKGFGRVDILVNNAGITGFGNTTPTMPEKRFRLVYEVNLFGPRDMIVRALPGMLERGWGRIVTVSSTAGDRSAPSPSGPPYFDDHRNNGFSAYCSSRAAVNMFTRVLAAEVHGKGISANTVAPVNSVITEVVQRALDAGELPANRFSAPEDPEVMAEAILALCVADPNVTTGLSTYSGQYLAEIGRPVRGRDGGPFTGRITTQPVRY